MHELEWSRDLQDILTTLDFRKIGGASYRPWRFTMISRYENGIDELEKSTNSNVGTGQSDLVWYNPRLEHIVPHQTNVACAKKEKLFENFKILCLFGPSKWLRKIFKEGDPRASKCLDGYEEDNGLCVRAGKKTQTGTDFTTNNPTIQKQENDQPGPEQLQFIQKLNEKRREYAVKWNISNMHELSWNVKPNETWTEFTMETGGFDGELVELKQIIQGNKSVEHGLLDPMKIRIKCGYDDDNNTRLYCIFAPGNATTKYEDGTPGSNCLAGFENNHGLCSRATTKATTRTTSPGRNPGNSIETRTLPKELEDYVEVDGDDYDEDFPTGEPLLDSGSSNFLQFWITVLVVFGSCLLI
ncbi:Protein CBG22821 [Caenorhabditis briggsae]|uniref:Protein CBG22821 n=1 Tax=Caenorhabditis briggsae TaxID=6238 RepID=A8Y349_CAEBR|nr:Protein CBG22821 [Caenorhabditis briggsae]CAP39318.1 Protein CBG22821 [Caenorhabditis briggsae]